MPITASPEPHFPLVLVYSQPVTRHFETNAPNDLKWPWKLKGQRYTPYTYYNYPRVPNFNPFRSTPPPPPHTHIFESQEDILTQVHQMTWNTKRSKVPHVHTTTTPGSQISITCTLRRTVLWVTSHFETSAPNDPKMTVNTKMSKVPE